ncbi:MAG: hypothetical protein WCJ17_03690 [bacterium]
MVNKYKFSLVACAALTLGTLWASDGKSASLRDMLVPIKRLVGDELRIQAHDCVTFLLDEFSKDKDGVAATAKSQFSVTFTDDTLRMKMAILGALIKHESRFYGIWNSLWARLGHDTAEQDFISADWLLFWFLHKFLWDVTRPTYEDVYQADLVKWALFPIVCRMWNSQNALIKQETKALLCEFYFSNELLSQFTFDDVIISDIMIEVNNVCRKEKEGFDLAHQDGPETWLVVPLCIVFCLESGKESHIVAMPRKHFQSTKPLPVGASLVIAKNVDVRWVEAVRAARDRLFMPVGPEDIQFATGHSSTVISHGEGSAGAGGGSAGASCS